MISVICSHCGETVNKADAIEVNLRVRAFTNYVINGWWEPLGVAKEHDEVDLCPNCREELGKWLTKAMPCDFDWDVRS